MYMATRVSYHLSLTAKDIKVNPTSAGANGTTSGGTSIVGPVVGAVVGGLVLVVVVALGVLLWRRRKRRQQAAYYDKNYHVEAQPFGTSGNVVSYTDLTLTGTPLRSDPEGITLIQSSAPQNTTVYNPTLNPQDQSHPPGLSSKAREAMMGARFTTNPNPSGSVPSAPSTSAYSSSGPGSSRDAPTEVGSPDTNLSQSDVQGLRMEVENLRRVMQEIQADRVEAPPSYAD